MNAVWVWLVKAWNAVRNFAPWKAIFITWLITMGIRLVLDLGLYAVADMTLNPILGFLFNVVVFFAIYVKVVYPRVYPDGWQKQ